MILVNISVENHCLMVFAWNKRCQTMPNNDKQSQWQTKLKKNIGFLSFIDRNTAAYFDSFGFEYIHQDVLSKVKEKSITHSIFRIEANASIMCRFCCIAFKENMKTEKTLLGSNLSFSNG